MILAIFLGLPMVVAFVATWHGDHRTAGMWSYVAMALAVSWALSLSP